MSGVGFRVSGLGWIHRTVSSLGFRFRVQGLVLSRMMRALHSEYPKYGRKNLEALEICWDCILGFRDTSIFRRRENRRSVLSQKNWDLGHKNTQVTKKGRKTSVNAKWVAVKIMIPFWVP